MFALSLVGGFFDELRTYYEVYAVVVLTIASGIAAWIRPHASHVAA
jgi:hypothetical protein